MMALTEPMTIDELLLQQQAAADGPRLQSYLSKGVANGNLEALRLGGARGDQPVTLYVRKPVATPPPRGRGVSPQSRVSQPFRSPARSSGVLCRASSPAAAAVSVEELHEEVTQLKQRLSSVEEQVCELSQDHDEADLQLYIDKLHDYNEIKDTGQILVGKMAELSGSTTGLLYQQFGLDQDD